jgi:hypothetical protein
MPSPPLDQKIKGNKDMDKAKIEALLEELDDDFPI